jgi:flagellar basal-body rod protein FlgF
MNNGIYTAYSGLHAQMNALDLLANNLANLNTAGFKEEMAYYSSLNPSAEAAARAGDLGSIINSSIKTEGFMNSSAGSMSRTNRELDLAIEGNGFLVVETPRGIRYTRNGSLSVNSKGILVASEGDPVMGKNGKPIALGPGTVNINEEGSVSLDGKEVERLKIVSFDDFSKLSREGNSLLLQNGKDQEINSSAKIRSGYLEQSNVNAVGSIVRMIGIMRQFEAIQKTVNLITNDMNTKSIEKLGR